MAEKLDVFLLSLGESMLNCEIMLFYMECIKDGTMKL